jgi:electron transfer flavoprotein beta subunit
MPQITYVENLVKLDGKTIIIKRNLGNGWQEVKGKLPVLLTVLDSANEPRVACARGLMKCKAAACGVEIEQQIRAADPKASEEQIKSAAKAKCEKLKAKGLLIEQWDLDMLAADMQWCGRDGSPTKVHRIQSVVLTAKESKSVEPTQSAIDVMVHELIVDHTLG